MAADVPTKFREAQMTYTDRDLIELACRAPAVPDWFEPDMSRFPALTENEQEFDDNWNASQYQNLPRKGDALFEEYVVWRVGKLERDLRYKREKVAQWPKSYARMVLESK